MQEVLDMENDIELLRKELSYKYDFCLATAFDVFARSIQYKINLDEFLFGLDRLDIPVQAKEASLFFSRYDSDNDGRLGFWELSNAFLPIDVRQRDEIEQRQPGPQMSPETKELFVRVLKKSIDLELAVENLRRRVQSNL